VGKERVVKSRLRTAPKIWKGGNAHKGWSVKKKKKKRGGNTKAGRGLKGGTNLGSGPEGGGEGHSCTPQGRGIIDNYGK